MTQSDPAPQAESGVVSASLGHVLSVATLVQVFATASVLALTGMGPLVATELGLNVHWIGYQISLIYCAGTISSAIAGSVIGRFGPSRTEQAAILCAALGFLGVSTGRIEWILLATILIGFGYGLNNPAASQLLSRVTPPRQRNLVFSIKQSGVPIGGILASVVLPVIAQAWGWRAGLLLGAAISLGLCTWLAVGHRDNKSARPQGRSIIADLRNGQATIWRTPVLRTLSVVGLLYSAMQLSMSAFAVISLVENAGWSVISAGAVAAAMQLAGAGGRIGWGLVADRIGGGVKTLAIIGLIMGACCILLFWIAVLPPAVVVVVFIVMGASSIGWNGVLLAEIVRHSPPASVGPLTGAVLVYTFAGVMIGPSGFGALFGIIGNYGTTFLVFSLTGLIGFLVCLREIRASKS
jgi:MFS family permease